MGHTRTDDDRRERMAGLLEMVRDECKLRKLSYTDEIATIAIMWLTGAMLHPSGSVARQLVNGPMPVELAEVKKTARSNGREAMLVKPAKEIKINRTSMAYAKGQAAKMRGMGKDRCPYQKQHGKLAMDWRAGFEEAGKG